MRFIRQTFVYSFTFTLAMVIDLSTAFFKKMGLEVINRKIIFMIIGVFGTDILEIREDYDPASQSVANKAIIAMPSRGCAHYFKNGGCSMCGFNKEVEKYQFHFFHPAAILTLVKTFLAYTSYKIKSGKIPIDSMSIFMGGSFLNPEEMPLAAQEYVIDFFIRSGIRKIIIESRPEYVLSHKDKLLRYVECCQQKQIEVAIGLEAVDDEIRNQAIRKNITLPTYNEAIATLNQLGILASTYVLIGAPRQSRKQMVDSAVKTAIYAWQTGSDIVNIEAYCVQKNTPWAKLHQRGQICLPSLWNIVEVVARINKVSGNWYLGKFSDWPPPIAMPDSCPHCRSEVSQSLVEARMTHNLDVFKGLPDCSCNR